MGAYASYSRRSVGRPWNESRVVPTNVATAPAAGDRTVSGQGGDASSRRASVMATVRRGGLGVMKWNVRKEKNVGLTKQTRKKWAACGDTLHAAVCSEATHAHTLSLLPASH